MSESDDARDWVKENLSEEAPLGRDEENIYISTVREHFAKIQMARERKYSFVQICRVFIKEKILSEGAKAKYLRQAFKREYAKQKKEGGLAELLKGNVKPIAKRIVPNAEKTTKPDAKPEPQNTGMSQEERNRKLGLGKPVNMGNGTVIRKYGDGSFDYD